MNKHLHPQSDTPQIASAMNNTPNKIVLDSEVSLRKCYESDPLSSIPLTNDTTVSVPITMYIIFDCSGLSYVDLSGSKELTSLHSELMKKEITLVLTNCCEPLIKQFERCNFFPAFPKSQIYPSIMDAVMTLQQLNDSAAIDRNPP